MCWPTTTIPSCAGGTLQGDIATVTPDQTAGGDDSVAGHQGIGARGHDVANRPPRPGLTRSAAMSRTWPPGLAGFALTAALTRAANGVLATCVLLQAPAPGPITHNVAIVH